MSVKVRHKRNVAEQNNKNPLNCIQLHQITINKFTLLNIDVLYYTISKLKKRPRSNPFTELEKQKHQLTKKPRAKWQGFTRIQIKHRWTDHMAKRGPDTQLVL